MAKRPKACAESLGTVTWRLPRSLDVRLPHVSIEGAAARAQYGAGVEDPDDAPNGETEDEDDAEAAWP